MIFTRKCKCHHTWQITEMSNVLQCDDMGYPLMLVIQKCMKCGKSEQMWIDVSERLLDKLDTGEYVLLKWNKV